MVSLTQAGQEPPPEVSTGRLFGIIFTFLGLATISMIIRVWMRIRYFRKLFSDDYLAFIGWLFLLATTIEGAVATKSMLMFQGVQSGLQKAPKNFLDQVAFYFRLQFSFVICFFTCIYFIKFSFLAFFRRLSNGVSTGKIYWWIVLALTVLAWLGSFVTQSLFCNKFTLSKCTNRKHLLYGVISLKYTLAADIVTDALILVIPVRLLWNLQIGLRRKISMLALLCVGALVIVISITRVGVLGLGSITPLDRIVFWAVIEASVAVIVCCVVSYQAFFSRRGEGTGSSSKSSPSRGKISFITSSSLYTKWSGSSSSSKDGSVAVVSKPAAAYSPHHDGSFDHHEKKHEEV